MTTLASPMPSPCSDLVATFRDDGRIVVDGNAPTKKWTPRVDGWRELIELSASRYGVPTAVVAAIMSLESGGNPDVESPAGALGLMQLMPSTYNMLLGRTKGTLVDHAEAKDPATNIDLGVKLLGIHLSRYKGNFVSAAVAYNAGSPKCGQCKCWDKKGCAEDPWGIKTDCGYVGYAIAAFNTALDHGYDPNEPGPPPMVISGTPPSGIGKAASVWPWIGVGILGTAVAIVVSLYSVPDSSADGPPRSETRRRKTPRK